MPLPVTPTAIAASTNSVLLQRPARSSGVVITFNRLTCNWSTSCTVLLPRETSVASRIPTNAGRRSSAAAISASPHPAFLAASSRLSTMPAMHCSRSLGSRPGNASGASRSACLCKSHKSEVEVLHGLCLLSLQTVTQVPGIQQLVRCQRNQQGAVARGLPIRFAGFHRLQLHWSLVLQARERLDMGRSAAFGGLHLRQRQMGRGAGCVAAPREPDMPAVHPARDARVSIHHILTFPSLCCTIGSTSTLNFRAS